MFFQSSADEYAVRVLPSRVCPDFEPQTDPQPQTDPEPYTDPEPQTDPDPYPQPESDDDRRRELEDKILDAREKKEKLEIDNQKKKIYVMALGILIGIFLLLIMIYTIFKCYLFCILRNELNGTNKRIRISRIGEVFIEENSDLNSSYTRNTNNINSDNYSNHNNSNDAPSCLNTNNSRGNTFNPDNYNPPYEEKPIPTTPMNNNNTTKK